MPPYDQDPSDYGFVKAALIIIAVLLVLILIVLLLFGVAYFVATKFPHFLAETGAVLCIFPA